MTLTRRELKDLRILAWFTAVYCRNHHSAARTVPVITDPALHTLPLRQYPVCADCGEFLAYAFTRRLRCPLAEKPACKHCPAHCYKPAYRERVREVMRFSGRHLILRGRFDLLWHYLR